MDTNKNTIHRIMELVEENKESVGDGAYLQISNWLLEKFKDEKEVPEILTGILHRPVTLLNTPEIQPNEWEALNALRNSTRWAQDGILEDTRRTALSALLRNTASSWGDSELSVIFKSRQAFEQYRNDYADWDILYLWAVVGWKQQMNVLRWSMGSTTNMDSTTPSDSIRNFLYHFNYLRHSGFQGLNESYLDEICQWKVVARHHLDQSFLIKRYHVQRTIAYYVKYGDVAIFDGQNTNRRPVITTGSYIKNDKIVERNGSKYYKIEFTPEKRYVTHNHNLQELNLYSALIQFDKMHSFEITSKCIKYLFIKTLLKGYTTPEEMSYYSRCVHSLVDILNYNAHSESLMILAVSGNNKSTRGRDRRYDSYVLQHHITIENYKDTH